MDKELFRRLNKRLQGLATAQPNMKTVYSYMFSDESLICAEENDGYRIRRHTFGAIKHRIEKASQALYSQYGAKDAFIGLEMENCVEWIVAFWAILRSGNKPYLINMRHPSSMTVENLKTLNIDTVVAVKEGSLPVEYKIVSDLESAGVGELGDEFGDGFAISTSATSLKQTICHYNGRKVVEQLLNSGDIVKKCPHIAANYKGQIKQLAFLPFYHIFGLAATYFWFGFFGCTMVFLPGYAPETITKTCRKHQVTHIFAVPMFWHSVEDEVKAQVSKLSEKEQKKFKKGCAIGTKLQNISPALGQKITLKLLSRITSQLFGPSIRFCISGGSYIRSSALELMNAIGCSLHNGYGMSEVGITSVEQRNKPRDLNRNAIGQPFGSVEYKISDEGTLLIRGRSLCVGVLTDGQYSPIDDYWFDSRDVVECVNGDYYIKGRMGDVVIGENGENINPDITEQSFSPANALRFSVLGLPNGDTEVLSMVVQMRDRYTKDMLDEMISSVYTQNEALPMTSAVKAFYITTDDIMPGNAVKVGRKYLLRGIEQGTITITPFGEATALTQEHTVSQYAESVREMVAEVLHIPVENIGNDAHLIFDLGASSFQYLSLIMLLEERLHVAGFLESGEKCYTVTQLCEYIERHL